MERFKKLATEFKGFVFGFVLSLFFVGGAVYAWQAVWHGTGWIKSGGIIEAQKIAENFEWLNKKIYDLENNARGPWEFLTVHSQSTEVPECPDGWEKISSGYSYISSHVTASGGILDLASPQSCVNKIAPLHVIECHYINCDYGTGGDFSLYLATHNLTPITTSSISDIQNMVSRCSVCRKRNTKVLAFHSMSNKPPSCPYGGKLLWTGYSLNSVRPHGTDIVTNLSSPGSCIKLFKSLPFVECRLGICEYPSPLDLASYLTATTVDTLFVPSRNALQYISRCAVCEFD